ncbi:hypothetical protein HanIR_Chr17g0866101 [Helianthus annuus]|nr:hypothetical protein HanIR_Chr17g0866101 [Helianthus annuus]
MNMTTKMKPQDPNTKGFIFGLSGKSGLNSATILAFYSYIFGVSLRSGFRYKIISVGNF